jgi:hypothetical protein
MEQLLAHMWGDYMLQTTWMADNKVKNTLIGYIACFVHCVFYTLPFLFITQNPSQLILIFSTHYPIDKFRLAKYVNQIKNQAFTNTGLPDSVPPYIAVWLLFIVDNIIHVTINYSILRWV